jgi:hypothetical protein
MVLVMCGSMIDLFFDQRFLKWASNTTGNNAFNTIRVSKTCLGDDCVVVFPPPTFTAPTENEPHGDLSANVGALEQASSVDSELTSLVQGNVEIAKISSANHPSMAAYIKKYPNVFVPEFFGEVDAQRKQGTTKNAEDDSAGTLNSDMVENESVSESVEELHAIHKTAKSLLGGGTSCSGALSRSQKRN